MDTQLLTEKLKRYDKIQKGQLANEIFLEFRSWYKAIQKHIDEVEMSNFEASFIMEKQEELIELLVKLLVITGNSDKLMLSRIVESEKLKKAVDFLFKNKDRVNHQNLYVIGTLLELAEMDGKEINTLSELVQYGRSGN